MKCKDVEQDIYLYSELSAAERMRVDAHVETCTACAELFAHVSSAHAWVKKASTIKPEVAHHARLTSNIMQAVTTKQTRSSSWVDSFFLKYALTGVSFVLVIAFGVEQLAPAKVPDKRIPTIQMATLTSASFSKTFLDRKENPEIRVSRYACVKSGACENSLIEKFKKKLM